MDHPILVKLFTYLDKFMKVDERWREPESQLILRFFQIIFLLVSTSFFGFAINYLIIGSYPVAAVQLVVSCVAVISALLFRKTQSVTVAANFIMIFGSLSAFFRSYFMGGIESPSFFFWPIIPVFLGVLIPLRWAAFWTGLYMAIAIFFHTAYKMGYTFQSKVSPEGIATVRIVVILAVQILLLLTVYAIRVVNRRFREIVEKQKETKANLIRILSHDLASPMTVINFSLEELEEKQGTSAELTKARRAITACQDIIGQIRELEALDASKIELQRQEVDLRQVFHDVEFLQHDAIAKKKIQFSVTFNPSSEKFSVLADQRSLTYQVMNNLVSNAIKFSDVGGMIHIEIHKVHAETVITVKDSGIGIPAKLLNILFDPNRQTTRKGTSGEKGTGFGMPIVRSYLSKFGATIKVSSKTKDEFPKDHGTEIEITFPKSG